MSKKKLIFKFDTELTADCVEWSPLNKEYFLCGTYELNQKLNQRFGKLYLFNISDNNDIKLKQKIDSDGIFDIKYSYNLINNNSYLGEVNSKGNLNIYKFKNEKLTLTTSINTKDTMGLSLDWNNRVLNENKNINISASFSNGGIKVFNFDNERLSCIFNIENAHEYEAWISSFNYYDKNIVYSGGDDTKMKGWDLRLNKPIWINKSHYAGVCSIQSNPLVEHEFVSGSYDEHVRLWDCRKMKNPKKEYKINGGVWRVKYHSLNKDLLLTACMHDGFKIVNLKDGEIISTFNTKVKDSLAYGVDWNLNNFNYIGACSFYDKKFYYWSLKE